uniref:DDE Tnp4 domain-containing protein n=1 Tax=Myripristis murdjan TaxID=586833 RepID=A0A667WJE6_9TELE
MYLSPSQRSALAVVLLRRTRWRRRRPAARRVWVHEILTARQRLGEYNLVQELQFHDDRFQVYFRLSREQFDTLLRRVGPSLERVTTNFRQPISPSERLAICLRYLATGDSYTTIASSYRVGISTVAGIIPDVCRVIWESLREEFLPVPKAADWREIAQGFHDRWNFPNCLGALDGKHIVIQAPANSGSQFFNYKGTYSIVLLALVDARYLFRVVDVGALGRSSDGGIFAASSFGRALREGTLDLPEDAPLPGAAHLGPMPHTFVADEAFPFKRNMLRPYPGRNLARPQRLFNYRLSRARRVVENAFGILAAQWRIFHRVIGVSPVNVDWIVKATVALHNFQRWNLTTQAESVQEPEAPPALQDLTRAGSNNASQEALAIREKFTSYFLSAAGEVPWQSNLA